MYYNSFEAEEALKQGGKELQGREGGRIMTLNTDIDKYIKDRLFELRDEDYRKFHSRLMPTVDEKKIIGVRTPQLRKLSGEISKMPQKEEFMKRLPHDYYEEYNLHGLLIERIRDYDKCTKELDLFLPYVDNWATCDMISPGIFRKHLPQLSEKAEEWVLSEHTYTIRFGIGMFMKYFLDGAFAKEYADIVSSVRSGEYYVNMMIAWYFATALAKQYERVLPYIEKRRLDVWTHNKTIQKAVESHRIIPEHKAYLKTLKIK